MNARHVLACAAWLGLAASARAAAWVQTSAADFSAGTLSSATLIGDDGTLRLAASAEAWTQIAGPNASDLFGLHMISNTEAWAVGATRPDAYNSYNAAHYDGSTWSNDDTARNGSALNSLWLTSADEGWTVGSLSFVLSYGRPQWFEAVDYLTPAVPLEAVHFVARSDGWSEGWAVGASGVILNFDGGWNPFPSPTTNDLRGVRMVSESEGWIVGAAGTILRYDGASWTSAASPTGNALNSVSVMPSGRAFAVGAAGTILRYDGSSWDLRSSPTSANLSSVWMTSNDEGWAVGDAGVILRGDGSNWTVTASPTGEALKAVSFGSPERGLAVGLSGTALKYARDYFAAGTFLSSVFDRGGGGGDWGTLSWEAAGTSPGVAVKFQVASGAVDPPTDFRGPDGTALTYYTTSGQALWAGHDPDRYIRYKAFFSTDSAVLTPQLKSVTISY